MSIMEYQMQFCLQLHQKNPRVRNEPLVVPAPTVAGRIYPRPRSVPTNEDRRDVAISKIQCLTDRDCLCTQLYILADKSNLGV